MKEKEIKVLMVKPHEHPEEIMLKNELKSFQEAVGGLIDILSFDKNVCILFNDEGKLIGLEGNRRIGNDIIAGNFYICGDNGCGELVSLNDEEIEKYKKMFYEPENITKEEVEETIKSDIYFFDM
jgi:hypothetical protein